MPLLLEMAILKVAAITELATYCFQSQSQFRGTEKPCRTIRKALEKLDLKQLQELSCSRKSLRNHPKILEKSFLGRSVKTCFNQNVGLTSCALHLLFFFLSEYHEREYK